MVQTREVKIITIRTAMTDSDRFKEIADQSGKLVTQECNFDDAEVRTKCNQETQTEVSTPFFVTDVVEGE